MNTISWIVLIVIVLLVIAAVAWYFTQKRRSEDLKQQFGPEYDRAVKETGDERRAQEELQQREKRVQALNIRDLSPQDRERFTNDWRAVQARFVDDPKGAIGDASILIDQVMQTRGYPVGDFEQRAADISVDHPNVVSNYRAARNIAMGADRGQATTEEMRKAMVYYRALFEELVGTPQGAQQPYNAA